MKYPSKNVLILIVSTLMSMTHAFADDSPTTPTTGIDVVRGAVKELEDELAARGSQTQLTSDDYRAWNKAFRTSLNQALDQYEQRIENEIVPKLQPLTERYNTIMNQTDLRDDQLSALAKVTKTQLQAVADSLVPVQEGIYSDTFNQIFSFLPGAKILSSSARGLRDAGSWLFGDENRYNSYHYQLSTLEPSSVVLMTGDCKWTNVTGVDPSAEKDRPIALLSLLTNSTSDGWNGCSKGGVLPTDLFSHFMVPYLKSGCQTQLCETLKEEDLLVTLQELQGKVDQGFVVQLMPSGDPYASPDESKVEVKISQLNIDVYSGLLKTQYVDPTLPFSKDTK
jgi:hypothetical protein